MPTPTPTTTQVPRNLIGSTTYLRQLHLTYSFPSDNKNIHYSLYPKMDWASSCKAIRVAGSAR